MAKKLNTYVIDTNVFLSDFNCLKAFGPHDIAIPMKVLEEIDKHKKRQDPVGMNARSSIRLLDELREENSLQNGVKLEKGGTVYVQSFDKTLLPDDLDIKDPDNQIICTALTLIKEGKQVVMVSRDVNMRVKCDALGLESEDYTPSQIVEDTSHIYTGLETIYVQDSLIDDIYAKKEVFLPEQPMKLYPNQFLVLVSEISETKSALVRFKNYQYPLKKISDKREAWGLKPRNKEQAMALDLLLDPDIKLVTIMGLAGGGKTLLAIAAGLHQILEPDASEYSRMIVSRPVQPLGKDIGFLPGTLEEKMAPWIAPIHDNLQALLPDKRTVEMYLEDGTIEVEALTYIRGRSIADSFIIIDECQNLSTHEVKTILTRVGDNTKIILTGDINQIDVVYHDATSNGLTYAVEKFKDYPIAGHITLQRGERSELASLAAEIL
jgi:PhoH-like ATPase